MALRHDDAHGGDAESGLILSVVCTAADETDLAQSHALQHGQESAVHGDSGYSGLDRRAEVKAAQDEGKLGRRIAWHIAMKRGAARGHAGGPCQVDARVVRAAQGADPRIRESFDELLDQDTGHMDA